MFINWIFLSTCVSNVCPFATESFIHKLDDGFSCQILSDLKNLTILHIYDALIMCVSSFFRYKGNLVMKSAIFMFLISILDSKSFFSFYRNSSIKYVKIQTNYLNEIMRIIPCGLQSLNSIMEIKLGTDKPSNCYQYRLVFLWRRAVLDF